MLLAPNSTKFSFWLFICSRRVITQRDGKIEGAGKKMLKPLDDQNEAAERSGSEKPKQGE